MIIKARYENKVLKPLDELNLTEGQEVEIEVIESNADKIVGLLKDIDIDSVKLQHAAMDLWVRRVVSD